MNISEAARQALKKYPYLDQYLELGIINQRGLARVILPEITSLLGTRPNIQSVVTALRRIAGAKGRVKTRQLEKILSQSEVQLKYDMAALTVPLGVKGLEVVRKRLLTEGDYMLLQGMESLTIVAKEGSINKVKDKLGGNVLDTYLNLAIIVVKSPKDITSIPGVIAYLANILALDNINVVEMMSSHAETVFMVKENDALRSVNVLRQEIKRSRNPIK